MEQVRLRLARALILAAVRSLRATFRLLAWSATGDAILSEAGVETGRLR